MMNRTLGGRRAAIGLGFCAALALAGLVFAQEGPRPDRPADGPPGGRGGPGGPGGVQPETKLVQQFDTNGNKRLEAEERKAAREFLAKEKAEGRGPRRPGPRGGPGGPRTENQEPVAPGPKLSPVEVKIFAKEALYDPMTVRTLFMEFESADWEKELADFYRTDVEVPVKLTVDGKIYPDIGVHFRGASSFFTVSEGRKRSFNLSMDLADKEQNLLGYHTLNLLNSHTDPSELRSILYYEVCRDYIPAPKANFMRVVINGESWGIYVNAQQFNKEFMKEWFPESKGARWKVPGSPRGRGGLSYLGEDAEAYKKIYAIKSKDDPQAWRDLIQMTKVLNQTPVESLEKELGKLLDIDGVLKWLALENVLINSDGYWIRSSDYNLCQDAQGRFHIIPHDSNETFRAPEGPGGPGGPRREGGPGGPAPGGAGERGRGVDLDPLAGAEDEGKPLLNKLLAVPALKARYFSWVRTITERSLDWGKLGPVGEKYQALIAEDMKTDTHKLSSAESFAKSLAQDTVEEGGRGPRPSMSLKSFVEQRRAFLLNHPEVKQAALLPATR